MGTKPHPNAFDEVDGALLGLVGLFRDEINGLGKGALLEVIDRNLPK
jgi:hypothetical protein